jgi:hypothetical protein
MLYVAKPDKTRRGVKKGEGRRRERPLMMPRLTALE